MAYKARGGGTVHLAARAARGSSGGVHLTRALHSPLSMASPGLASQDAAAGLANLRATEQASPGLRPTVLKLALTDVVSVPLGDFRATPLRSELVGRPGMAEFPDELRRFLGTQHDNLTYVSLVNSAVLNAKVAHAPDEYLSTSTHTVYAAPEFRRRPAPAAQKLFGARRPWASADVDAAALCFCCHGALPATLRLKCGAAHSWRSWSHGAPRRMRNGAAQPTQILREGPPESTKRLGSPGARPGAPGASCTWAAHRWVCRRAAC